MSKTYVSTGPLHEKWRGPVRSGSNPDGAVFTKIDTQLAMFAQRFNGKSGFGNEQPVPDGVNINAFPQFAYAQ